MNSHITLRSFRRILFFFMKSEEKLMWDSSLASRGESCQGETKSIVGRGHSGGRMALFCRLR